MSPLAPITDQLTILAIEVTGFEDEFIKMEDTKEFRVQNLPVEARMESYGQWLEERDGHGARASSQLKRNY